VLRSVCADDASDGFRRPTLRVIKMLSQLVHPHIVRLLEVIKDSDESAICNGNTGMQYYGCPGSAVFTNMTGVQHFAFYVMCVRHNVIANILHSCVQLLLKLVC
jgi:hypothetical protein